jgi:hypothetical protein
VLENVRQESHDHGLRQLDWVSPGTATSFIAERDMIMAKVSRFLPHAHKVWAMRLGDKRRFNLHKET